MRMAPERFEMAEVGKSDKRVVDRMPPPIGLIAALFGIKNKVHNHEPTVSI
jgi:hypothetical protein